MRPGGDQRIEVGTGGQVVRERLGREGCSAQYQRRAGPTRPVLEIKPDTAPRLAGWKGRSIDSPGLAAGRAAVQTGGNHGESRPAGNRVQTWRSARCKAPRSPLIATSARASVRSPPRTSIARQSGPDPCCRAGDPPRGLRPERIVDEPLVRQVVEPGVGCAEQGRAGA